MQPFTCNPAVPLNVLPKLTILFISYIQVLGLKFEKIQTIHFGSQLASIYIINININKIIC